MQQRLIVPENKIDPQLVAWQEVEDGSWRSLLLGNGFSINIWPKFSYSSLFDVAKLEEIGARLDSSSVELFNRLKSTNFEDVLRVLFHARLVDEQLKSPQREEIASLYLNTKNALAAAVNYSHVPAGFAGLHDINKALRSHQNIFTTNYDLIPYWSIMQEETWRFRDLFWGEGTTFNPHDTEVYADRTAISYLHGALHLVELPDGTTKKLTANGLNTLADLFDLDHPEYFPLIISEGSAERKLSRIKRNDYLRFCFEKLQSCEGNMVVIGHSLHKDYDQHLLDALREGALESIAIGVFPKQSPENIVLFKARIHAELKGKKVYFFDSQTHPLGNPALAHQR